MSMINPVGNQISQPWSAHEQTAQQNVAQNVRAGRESSVHYAPESAEWVAMNPVKETKEKEKIYNEKGYPVKQECKTCKKRRYQDGSNDPGVSFKFAQHVDPDTAAGAVRAHEMEHIRRNQANAMRSNKDIVYQKVAIHTDICPECGRIYVSGGTTTTLTREHLEEGQQAFAIPGENLDIKA